MSEIFSPDALRIPEARIDHGKGLLVNWLRQADCRNLRWLALFGSFWSPEIHRIPGDIDIAAYVLHFDKWMEEDIANLRGVLSQFGLPVEIHSLYPQSFMIRNVVSNYQTILRDAETFYGDRPTWLS